MADQLLRDVNRAAEAPAVTLRGVRRAFGNRRVLAGIDLDIRRGEFVALIGQSGAGKSTLLRMLAHLDDGVEGWIQAPDRLAVVFQEPRLLPWKKVWRNVVLGLKLVKPREAANAALGEVGLAERADAWPVTLSGGEAQRVALARALVREPELLLLDEPFGALDALTRLRMHGLVAQLCERHGPAVLLVTHDVDEAIALADRVLVLDGGYLSADITVELPRPRQRKDPAFEDLRATLLGHLGIVSP